MLIKAVKSKIHRVTITQAELNYIGSITIDEALMEASNIIEGERVQIVNLNNAARLETYVIKGERNSGVICLNGPSARLVAVGDKVSIIGYGYMGEAFAKRLQGFGANVIAYDKYKKDFGTDQVKEVSLSELQANSDVISIHLPYTEETHYYVDEQFIANCKKPFYLINTARGKSLKTSALVSGLASKKVLGACLDVSEFESLSFENLNKEDLPQAFQDLIASDKVILSPHVAGWTVESYEKLSSFLADKIIANY